MTPTKGCPLILCIGSQTPVPTRRVNPGGLRIPTGVPHGLAEPLAPDLTTGVRVRTVLGVYPAGAEEAPEVTT